ncbi:MAG: hypothetical protein ACK5XN_18850 [Bacteroidota bacterium]
MEKQDFWDAAQETADQINSIGWHRDQLLTALKEITDAYLAIHNGEETGISAKARAAIAQAEGR